MGFRGPQVQILSPRIDSKRVGRVSRGRTAPCASCLRPAGTIEVRTKPNDHRVHQRKDGRWCCRVTVKEPGESRGRLRSFYFNKRWRAVAKLIQVDPSAGRWHIDDENMTVGDWL